MCGQSHRSPHTPSQLPQQLFAKGQILAQSRPHSLYCARVPMGISEHQRGATPSFPQRDRHLGR